MAGWSSAMIGWSLTDVSVLGSQVFGQALMDSCDVYTLSQELQITEILIIRYLKAQGTQKVPKGPRF